MATEIYIPSVFETGNLTFSYQMTMAIESGFSPIAAFNSHRTLTDYASPAEDQALNLEAVEHGERVFTAHDTTVGKVWIITEWDRSVTTVLFPSEY